MRHYIRDLLYLVLALIVVVVLLEGFRGLIHLPEAVAFHLGVVAIAGAFGLVVILKSLRKEIVILRDHSERLDARNRRSVLAFLRPRLRDHLREGRRLTSSGIKISEGELQRLVDAAFEDCRRSYQGTDSHPPSELNKLYPTFIMRQTDRQRRRMNCDTRYLLVTRAKLQNDFSAHRSEVKKFIDDHVNKGVALFRVEPSVATAEANRLNLPSADIGVFQWQFVVFFTPPAEPGGSYTVQSLPLERDLCERVAIYLNTLCEHAEKIEISSGDLGFQNRNHEQKHATKTRMYENDEQPPPLRPRGERGWKGVRF